MKIVLFDYYRTFWIKRKVVMRRERMNQELVEVKELFLGFFPIFDDQCMYHKYIDSEDYQKELEMYSNATM